MYTKKSLICISIACVVSFSTVGAADENQEGTIPGKLNVTFSDQVWDGKRVPAGQQCQRFEGKKPMTPSLFVAGISPKANLVIMEYSDRSYPPMDNGGHGKMSYKIKPGSTSVTIPSVPGHSFDLPAGFSLISAHKAPGWDTAGAYMPPCSGGSGNAYYVTVKTLYQPSNKKSKTNLLGEIVLELGRY